MVMMIVTMRRGLCDYVFALLLLAVGLATAGPDDIYLENGGYKGILVAIDDNVAYDPNFLSNLKSLFVDGSKALYKATEYDIQNSGNPAKELTSGKHFAEIRVLLPKSWPPVSGCDSPKSDIYGNADYRVNVNSKQFGLLLYTHMMNAGCREPGLYTVLPETFVNDPTLAREYYGEDLGKPLVHEFAQMRWGIREESNNKDGGDSCLIASDWNTMRFRQALRCSLLVSGANLIDPTDDDKCTFTPAPDTLNVATGSIMYFRLPFYTKMYTFCDSRYTLPSGATNMPPNELLHDAAADHPHNQVCNRESAWQVLREHPDFDVGNAGPLDLDFDFDANLDFKCVQQPGLTRMVLVLDVSGSMDGERMVQMQGDVALFLQSVAFEETEIGMLQFASTATLLVGMIPLNSTDNLNTLLDAIPNVATGGTCIGCGLKLAIEMLEEGDKSVAGALIIVFTDGGENQSPTIADMADAVLAKEAIVHGLLMDGVADDHDLIKLSLESGGDYCIYEDSGNNGSDYYQCLMRILDLIGNFAAVEVKTEDVSVPGQDTHTGSVPIDSSFQDSLRVVLSWTADTFAVAADGELDTAAQNQKVAKASVEKSRGPQVQLFGCNLFELSLTAPDGSTIADGDPRYSKQEDFRLIMVDASGFEAGEWTYQIKNGHTGNCDGRLRIEGFPDRSSPDDEQQPILMTARASKNSVNVQKTGDPEDNIVSLYVTLMQGQSPVLDADVVGQVVAGSYSKTVTFTDNGAGADNAASDGIYSAYFYDYDGDNVYSVRAFATGVGGQTTILRESRSLAQDQDDGYRVVKTQSHVAVTDFERAAIGGAFEVATNGVSDMNRIIPPARINDLRRGQMAADSVELAWTAVGASMNDGTADRYEVRVCMRVDQAFGDCMIVEEAMLVGGTLESAQPAGSEEHISVGLDYLEEPALDTSYYVAVKAVDEFSNAGEVSNLAQLQGPVTPDNQSSAIVAGTLACIAVIATASVGGVIIVRNKRANKIHTVV